MVFENYHLYRIAVWLVLRLPRGFVYFVAGFVAELNFFLNARSRRGVYANQDRVARAGLSALKRWRMARAVFRNFAYSVIDFFHLPLLNHANIGRYLAGLRGWEHVEAAMANGKGGILVTVHMGSWELAGACVAMQGVPLTVAALSHKDPRVDAIFLHNRTIADMEVVPLGGAMPKLENALTRGRFIALVSDRDIRGKGPKVPFFGQPTHVPDGHARLALRTGAWIIPVMTYRVRDSRIVVEFRPPIIADPARDTVEGLVRETLVVLEEFIRAHPEQWLSFFNLWSETERPVA